VSSDLAFRSELSGIDPERIALIVAGTGFFTAEEVGIAVELAEETRARGAAAGYEFLLLDADGTGELAGYACFGRIPATENSWDLYWIVVGRNFQRLGLGRRLLAGTEAAVRRAGGARLYIDTSSRPQYLTTRRFYAACGYTVAAELPDFYRAGDGKVIYVKALGG
jgi:GNAT superfamily N-acetyltransferase